MAAPASQVHVMLMYSVGMFLFMLAVITYFSKFDMGTWRAFGAILLLGPAADLYIYYFVPTISSQLPLAVRPGSAA